MLDTNNKLTDVNIDRYLNTTRIRALNGLIKSIIHVKKSIIHCITEFELYLIISNSGWKVVRETEGILNAGKTLCTVLQ